MDLVVNQKRAWKPLSPTAATRTGDTILVAFQVPNPPLAWSTHLAPPHQTKNAAWAAGKGFEVVDAAGAPLRIASVAVEGANVRVKLAATPAPGAALTVRYAITQDGEGNQGGQVVGLRGLLRDSDDFAGAGPESVDVNVTRDDAVVRSVTPGGLARRTGYDRVRVEGGGATDGLAADTVVLAQDSVDAATLSAPWTGPTGTAKLAFVHDHRNYAVHFVMAVAGP